MRVWLSVGVLGLAMSGPARAQDEFTADETKAVVQSYLSDRMKADGVFHFKDPRSGETLDLELEQVRLVRQIHLHGKFVDVDFHVKGNPEKKYDLDFWLRGVDGKLQIVDVRVHKAPKQEDGVWKLITRTPVPWWWIPASEHPGESEEKRGWELESAVHQHIAGQIKDGALQAKDDVSGAPLNIEFVEIHQPLRKLEGKGYFACSDFREKGSKDKYYDIDFWLVEENGKLRVTEMKVHKEPKQEDGRWIQVPRYTFDKDKQKIKDVP